MDNSQNSGQDLAQTISQIEKDLLNVMVARLKDKKIAPSQAQSLAQDFISQLPPQDKVSLLAILKKVTEMHPEAREVYLKYANEQFQDDRTAKLQQATIHLQNGNIEQALAVVRGDTHGA